MNSHDLDGPITFSKQLCVSVSQFASFFRMLGIEGQKSANDHSEEATQTEDFEFVSGGEAMKSHSMREQIAAAALGALLMLVPGPAQAQTAQSKAASAKPPAVAAKPTEPEAANIGAPQKEESRGGPHEGIRVHGHWTIVVKNEDGTVASRNEFENALVTTGTVDGGDAMLSAILSRNLTPGRWLIKLDGTPQFCANVNSQPSLCWITESGTSSVFQTFGGVAPFFNLTVLMLRPTPSLSTFALSLSGTARAASAGNVTSVATVMVPCQTSQSPAACVSSTQQNFGNINFFTSRTLAK